MLMSSSLWMRKAPAVVLALVLVGLGLTCVAEAGTPKKVTIFTGSYINFTPIFIADSNGYFKAEGLDATVIRFTSGAEAVEAFRSGQGHLVLSGDFPAMKLWALGDAVGIAPTMWNVDNVTIVTKREIRRAADLRGKRLGTRLGSTLEFFVYKYLASAGMGPKDITIVNLAPPEQIIALDKGEIDALAWDQLSAMKASQVSGDRVHLLTTGKGYFREWLVLSANQRWAQENREAVVAVLRAIRRANQFINERPAEAEATVAQYTKIEPSLLQRFFHIYKYDLTFTKGFRTDMEAMADFMVGQRALPKPIDWNAHFDASFLRAVDPVLVE